MKNTNFMMSQDRPLRNTITALKTQSDEDGIDTFPPNLHKKQQDFIIKRNNYAQSKPNKQLLPPIVQENAKSSSKIKRNLLQADTRLSHENTKGSSGNVSPANIKKCMNQTNRSTTLRPQSFVKKQNKTHNGQVVQHSFSLERPVSHGVGSGSFNQTQYPSDFYQQSSYYSYQEFYKNMTKHFNLDNPAPYVSARSWIMTNLDTGELMYAKRENEQRQVASLTKIMTTHVVMQLLSEYGLNPDNVRIRILTSSTTPILGGTSACLKEKDKLSVSSLLYGMMLPSGNDAAQSLGIYFGNLMIQAEALRKSNIAQKKNPNDRVILIDGNIIEEDYIDEEEEQKQQELSIDIQEEENLDVENIINELSDSKLQEEEEEQIIQDEVKIEPTKKQIYDELITSCLERFYKQMNYEALQLGLKKSNFASAHGMYVEENWSTAADVAKMCHHVMKNSDFKSIVNESYWECSSQQYPGHVYKWTNTNFLLKQEPGCTGIKTGVTWQAGPCLAASMRSHGYHICVVVLSCCSPESRWYEVPKLINWGVKKIQKIQQSKLRPKMRRKLIKNFTYI